MNMLVKSEVRYSVPLTILEQLAFNAQKFRGSCDPGHAPFSKKLRVMSGLSQGTDLSDLKAVSLTVLQQLPFKAQKFRGHVTMATPPFRKIFKESCRDCPWEHACQI